MGPCPRVCTALLYHAPAFISNGIPKNSGFIHNKFPKNRRVRPNPLYKKYRMDYNLQYVKLTKWGMLSTPFHWDKTQAERMRPVSSEFPRILTLLRKERGISQKQAAASLGVSQALLSHYENGIRECGLSFVVKAADFYGVSCDYLLGRTADPGRRETSPPPEEEKPPAAEPESETHQPLTRAFKMLLALCDRIGCPALSREVERYLTAAVYRMFRRLYRVHPRNAEGLFTLPGPRGEMLARCRMEEAAAEADIIAGDLCGEGVLTPAQREKGALTTETLSGYGEDGKALLALIREEENGYKKE